MKKFLSLSILFTLVMLFGFANVSPSAAQTGTTFYVKQAATGTGDGLSWANATTLQAALGSATSGAEIWVAKGLYKPTGGTDQTVSFNLVPGVAVYGGFPATGAPAFNQRDWVANPTVLSGDLGGDDITDANGVVTNWANIKNTTSYNNSFHVVIANGTTGTPITNSTILDGFTITAGDAGSGNPGSLDNYKGGGFYCKGAGSGNDCSPSLTNVTFSGNQAGYDGGAMYNDGGAGGSSSPTLTNVTFNSSHSVYGLGGAMYNNGFDGGNSSPSLTDVTFDGNSAGLGGAMYNNGSIRVIGAGGSDGTSIGNSNPTLTNVTFSNNSATTEGGAMYNDGTSDGGSSSGGGSSPTLTNVTFSNNSAFDGGAMYNAGYNSGDSSPSLTDVTFDGNSAEDQGGAMYNDGSYVGTSNPMLTNVAFDGNSATTGGAMYNVGACSGDSSPILNRVTFSNNSASSYGGAMYNEVQDGYCSSPGYSNPILTNVAFSSNLATRDGGAIYYNFACTTCAIPASLTNVSFSLNSAIQGGAIYNNAPPSKFNNIDYRSSLTLTNVIFWGDSATSAGAEIYNRGADLTISYSVIEGGVGAIFNFDTGAASTTGTVTDGGNNLTSDPLFVNAAGGDLQLPSGSPAVDAGDDAVCPATDLLGASRPQGAQCDIGAYEYVPPFFTVTFNANGGSGTMAPQTSNTAANLTSNSFTRTDYNFTGWNTAADGTGTAYADGASYDFAADLNLFAQWSDSTDFVITVKTDNLLSGSSSSTQFAIPTIGSGYNYNVDCNNDGTDEVTGYTSSTGYICDYGPTGLNTGPGTYTIRIKDNSGRGTGFPRIYFNYGKERLKLLDVQQWGTGKWSSMNKAFSGCNNLGTFTATDSPDLSLVTDMSFMFTATYNFSADLHNWDTSHVTNMAYMFNDTNFNGDIGSWNTGNVTNMVGMFKYAIDFNQDISNWDTSKVTNMGEMFVDADAFNQNISGWNTGNVTNMNYMFQNTNVFNQNLGAWDVSKVTTAINMFAGKTLSTANYDALLIGWDAQTLRPNVTFSGGYSRYCDGAAARANMIASDGWIITDSGQASCYTVTFNANGGTGTMAPQTSNVRANLTANAFTRTGYTFTGWTTEAGGGGIAYADEASYAFSADATLYAQWSSSTNTYTVTFNANGGTGTMAPQISSVAANLTANAFTRTGYTFTGWNTAANGSGTGYANTASYPFTADATLYAQWSINTYTVTFNANGGTGTMAPQTSSVAANLTANAFTRTGYTFTGWNTVAGGGGTSYADTASYPFTADATLYAQWTINTYTVTFDANGGTGTMAPQTGSVAANLTANAFTMTGYTFTGWNTAANGSGTSYADTASYPFTADATLYAQWTINTYSVTFDANGGSGIMRNQTSNYNVAANLTANTFTRTGYTFTGWNTAAGGSGTSYADTASYPFTADATLYAQWSITNDAPVANIDSYSTNEDTALVEATVGPLGDGVLANDTDADSNPLTAVLDTTTANGVLVLNTDGSFTYTPAANYCGADSFTYHANDGMVDSNTATVDIDVVCVDDAPAASDDTATVTEDDPATTINVLTNDTDVDGGPKSIASVTQPANGTVVNNGTDLTYLPDANFCNNGSQTDDFTYTLTPGDSFAAVRVTVTCINDAPVADNDSDSTNEDTALSVAAPGVLDGDTDVENDLLTAVLDTTTSNGLLELSSDGSFTYTPNADFCGADSFTYHANDGTVDSNIATVDIDVVCVDDAPAASDDTATVTEDDPATTINVLTNDTDVDGGPKSIASVTQPANGTVVNNGTDLTYLPDANFCNNGSQTDDFTYTLTPGDSFAAVRVTVTCVDDAPAASDDTATVTEDDPATTINVLTNDTDVDGGPKSIASVTQPAHGTVVNNGTDLTYLPDANFCNDGSPTDNFTYTLTPGDSFAAVRVTVTCINDAPVADNDSDSTNEDTALSVAAPGVLDGDTDVENDLLTAVLDTTTSNGLLELSSDGSFTYTPNADFCGADSFTYHANDGTVDSNIASVDIDVTCVDDAPVVTVDVNSQTVQYSDIIADVTISATDVDSASLSIGDNAFSDLSVGNESCSPSGSGVACTWKLSGQALVAEGTNTITFTVSDGNSSDSASTEISVKAEDATVTFGSGNPIAVPVSTAGGDSEPFFLTVNVQEASESGSNTAPGDINRAPVSVTLEPVGPGSPVTAACATPIAVTPSDYSAVLEVKCDFSGVPVNAYVATATVSGGYYTGSGEDSLVVYDTSLGFTTGGGSFYWPGSNDRTTFGYTMKYNKKATKVQGNLVLIRHLPDGSIYRLKSNAIDGLALGEESSFGWASFSGKTTYKEPSWLEAQGNYTFTAYVEDHGEPGSSDRFWIEVRDKDGNVVADLSVASGAPANAETLQGGNIVVPRK